MEERRKHKRRHSIFYIKVYDEETGKMAGRLVDITTGGMMLVSEEPIEVGTISRFKMPLPEKIRDIGEISFKARSVWNGPDINDDFFDTGFQFIEPSFETIDLICDSFENRIFTDSDLEEK